MTDLVARDVNSLSHVTRLVEGTLACVEATQCCAAPVVTVLRGFDVGSRRRTTAVSDRLRRHDLTVRSAIAALVADHDHLVGALKSPQERRHTCVFVDATSRGHLEVDRIAGWYGIPVVTTLRDTPPHQALLRMHGTDTSAGELRTFPSAAGKVVGVAFDVVTVVPNQPETGVLRLHLEDGFPVDLPTGYEVELRLLDEHVRVHATSPASDSRTWVTSTATVDQLEGVHTVHRDGLLVADLDDCLVVDVDATGLTRWLA